MKISYDSSDLIAELKRDIEEFGDIKIWAISRLMEGTRIYTDYDFIMSKKDYADALDEGEEFPKAIQTEVGEKKETMQASKLLHILEEQDKIVENGTDETV